MLRCGCRLGHVFMGGGWGGVGWGRIIPHWLFHTYVMLRYCWTSMHTSCYATVRSLGLPRIRHATLLYVLLDFHAYAMLRYCTFSWTSTHTSCYAIVRSLGLPRVRHAILLYQYVLLDFHTYVMLRYCTFSWTSTHTSCYATVSL